MRITIPSNLKCKDLFKYLINNKAQLIEKKKMLPIKSDPLLYGVTYITPSKDGDMKGMKVNKPIDEDTVRVKVVANTAWLCDEHMDVLTDKSYDKSVREKGKLLPHIKNHAWDDCTAHVGDVLAVYTQSLPVSELGYNKDGNTTALIWETDIRKEYDEKVYRFYKNGKINQHSIGLQYLDLELAINDKDSEKEYDFWKKYVNKIINKEKVEEAGYFWLVSAVRLIENSAVLFGANELTPTLEIADGGKSLSTVHEPDITTHEQPQKQIKSSINFASLI